MFLLFRPYYSMNASAAIGGSYMQRKWEWPRVLIAVAAVAVTLGLGIFANFPQSQWYAQLKKPLFQPPDVVFAIVWGILYVMLGICAALLFGRKGYASQRIYVLFALNLVLNALYSLLFFKFHLIIWSMFAVMLLLWCTAFLLQDCWRLNRWTGALLFPYLLWVGFATVLHYVIAMLN